MPIYTYVCKNRNCGPHFTFDDRGNPDAKAGKPITYEINRKIDDRHLPVKCLVCDGDMVMVPSVPAVAVVSGGTGASRGAT